MENCKRKVDKLENPEVVDYPNIWDLEIKDT